MPEITERLTAAVAGRYQIERHIGEGGMATVYLARDLKHDRKVAVKVLRPELAAVLGAERFVQEIKTTANLQHPHILPLFDSGEADGFLYYVMPFIDGETLRDKLSRETQLGIDEAVRITTELADALDYAHRNQVIHRDIKPENILLHDGRPMVADFGIALAVSAAAGGRMTETGLSLGTPHYMSPEQATAEKDVTNRSDIYSLGSMMYEMLTGSPPAQVGSSERGGRGLEVAREVACGSVRHRRQFRGGSHQPRVHAVHRGGDDSGAEGATVPRRPLGSSRPGSSWGGGGRNSPRRLGAAATHAPQGDHPDLGVPPPGAGLLGVRHLRRVT
jgi:serine/threonine-protein kinase